MRLSAMVASEPWTLMITLIEDPDSLGIIAQFQALNGEGALMDAWELYYPRLAEALAAMERDYGLSPDDWIDLD